MLSPSCINPSLHNCVKCNVCLRWQGRHQLASSTSEQQPPQRSTLFVGLCSVLQGGSHPTCLKPVGHTTATAWCSACWAHHMSMQPPELLLSVRQRLCWAPAARDLLTLGARGLRCHARGARAGGGVGPARRQRAPRGAPRGLPGERPAAYWPSTWASALARRARSFFLAS